MSSIQTAALTPRYISLEQAVRYTSLSPATLDRMIRAGRLESFIVGRRRLLEVESLDHLVRSGRAAVAV